MKSYFFLTPTTVPVGEALAANSNTLQHSITPELVEHEGSVDLTGALLMIGDDATNEVGVRVSQCHLRNRKIKGSQ